MLQGRCSVCCQPAEAADSCRDCDKAYSGQTLTFREWMEKIDRLMYEAIGFETGTFPDQFYREWYENGYAPEGAAMQAVKNEWGNVVNVRELFS